MEALRDYGVESASPLGEGEFPVRRLVVGGGCTMCLRCNVFCPTGALRRKDDEKEARVEFDAALCMNCFECREFCPTGALGYEKEIDVGLLTGRGAGTLAAMEKTLCTRCRKPYIAALNRDGCPRCRKKEVLERRIETVLFGSSGAPDEKTIH